MMNRTERYKTRATRCLKRFILVSLSFSPPPLSLVVFKECSMALHNTHTVHRVHIWFSGNDRGDGGSGGGSSSSRVEKQLFGKAAAVARSVYNGQRYSVIVMYHMVYTIRIKICLIFVYHERKIIHNVLLIATNSIWAIKYISLSSVFPSSSSPFFHVLYGFSFVSEQNQKRKHSTSIIFHNSKTMKAKLRQREHVVQTNMHKYEGMH